MLVAKETKSLESQPDFNMRKCFKSLDVNGYGFIDEKSLRMFMKKLGHQLLKREVNSVIRRIDTNGDGRIGLEEFKDCFKGGSHSVSKKAGKSVEILG